MRRIAALAFGCAFVLCPAWAFALTIDEIQQTIDKTGAAWRAGENPVWDEYQATGWAPTGQLPVLNGTESRFIATGRTDLPAQLDWRNLNGANYVTPIKEQRPCGACWAFGTVATIETAVAYAKGWTDPTINLSEQDILSCTVNFGCQYGGWTTSAFNFARETGIVDEACFPYVHEKVDCSERCADWQSRVTKIHSWDILGNGIWATPQEIMEALQINPVATSMVDYEDFRSYTGGIYTTVTGKPLALHVVTIIGYDAEQQYWIGKNSWGTDWGENGFFRIHWGAAEIGMFAILPHYLAPADDDDDNDNDDNDDNDNDDNDNDDNDNDDNDNDNDDVSPDHVDHSASRSGGCGG